MPSSCQSEERKVCLAVSGSIQRLLDSNIAERREARLNCPLSPKTRPINECRTDRITRYGCRSSLGFGSALLIPFCRSVHHPAKLPRLRHPHLKAEMGITRHGSELQARVHGAPRELPGTSPHNAGCPLVQREPGKAPQRYRRWSKDEDNLLLRAVGETGGPPYSWTLVSANFFDHTRSPLQCKTRWKRVSRSP